MDIDANKIKMFVILEIEGQAKLVRASDLSLELALKLIENMNEGGVVCEDLEPLTIFKKNKKNL